MQQVIEIFEILGTEIWAVLSGFWEFFAVGALVVLLLVLRSARNKRAMETAPMHKLFNKNEQPEIEEPEEVMELEETQEKQEKPRRRWWNRKKSVQEDFDDDIEFLEVGPEPVIVYRSQQKEQEEQEAQQKEQEQLEAQKKEQEQLEAQKKEQEQLEAQKRQQEQLETQKRQQVAKEEPIQTEPTPEPKPVTPLAQEPKDKPQVQQPESEPRQQVFAPAQAEPEVEPDHRQEPKEINIPSPVQHQHRENKPLPYLESDLAIDVINLFRDQGYYLEDLIYQGQYGADFIITRPGVRAYIQVKDWKKKVAENIINEAYKYSNNNDCNNTIVVAPSFDRSAAKASKRYGVTLLDKKALKKQRKNFTALADIAATND